MLSTQLGSYFKKMISFGNAASSLWPFEGKQAYKMSGTRE